MALLPRATVVECGVGDFSTEVLLHGSDAYFGIEHDQRWAEIAATRFNRDSRFHLLTRQLPVAVGDLRESFTLAQVAIVEQIYDELRTKLPEHYDVLFVDTFSGVRLTALEKLYDSAHTIVIHDTEPANFYGYAYNRFLPRVQDRHRYTFCPTGVPHTDVYTYSELGADFERDLLAKAIAFFGDEFRLVGVWQERRD